MAIGTRRKFQFIIGARRWCRVHREGVLYTPHHFAQFPIVYAMPEASRDLPYVIDLLGTARSTVSNSSGVQWRTSEAIAIVDRTVAKPNWRSSSKRHVVEYVVLASVSVESKSFMALCEVKPAIMEYPVRGTTSPAALTVASGNWAAS